MSAKMTISRKNSVSIFIFLKITIWRAGLRYYPHAFGVNIPVDLISLYTGLSERPDTSCFATTLRYVKD